MFGLFRAYHRDSTTAPTSLVSNAFSTTVTELRETNAKICFHALLAIILVAGVLAIATNNGVAVAQQPCQLQLGQPNASVQQYGGNLQLTLPVSASCSFYAGQLYVTGSAYDTTYGTSLGTAQAVLSSAYGGYGYTGQLTFTVPSSAQGHSVQFWVSTYGGQNGYYGGHYGGSVLAQTSSTYVVNPIYPGYPAYPSYPSYPTYPTYLISQLCKLPTIPTVSVLSGILLRLALLLVLLPRRIPISLL